MQIIYSYILVSLRKIIKSKWVYILPVLAFSVSIVSFIRNDIFSTNLERDVLKSGAFENFRIFDSPPYKNFYWDELEINLAISYEKIEITDNYYPILAHCTIVPAKFLDKNFDKKVIFASNSIFNFLGIESPGKIDLGEFYFSKNLQIEKINISGREFKKGKPFEEILESSAYDFDIIIPIEYLPSKYFKEKIFSTFLMVAPGYNAPEISRRVNDLDLTSKYYSVRVNTANSVSSGIFNAKELRILDVLDLFSFSILAMSFLLYFIIRSLSAKEEQKELLIRKLNGEGFFGLFIKYFIDVLFLIIISLSIAVFFSILFFSFNDVIYTLINSSLVVSIITFCLFTSLLPTIKNYFSKTEEIIKETYLGSLKPVFFYPLVIFGLTLILSNFIFFSNSNKQLSEFINSKESPYEDNFCEISTPDFNQIELILLSNSYEIVSSTNKITTINFKPESFAENIIMIYSKLGTQTISIDNYQLEKSMKYYYNIIIFYKNGFLVFLIIGIVGLIGLILFILNNIRYDIALLKMIGAKYKNITYYNLKLLGSFFFLSLPAAWITAFFMMSSWLGKFESQASFNFIEYLNLSLVFTVLMLLVGILFSAYQQSLKIATELKNK